MRHENNYVQRTRDGAPRSPLGPKRHWIFIKNSVKLLDFHFCSMCSEVVFLQCGRTNDKSHSVEWKSIGMEMDMEWDMDKEWDGNWAEFVKMLWIGLDLGKAINLKRYD